jgi:predicted aldo/keto reductase-like oxidoreductase
MAATVTLGRTGLTVGKNGFGALPIQRIDAAAAGRLLNRALDNGFGLIDTARAYTDSERKIGLAVSHRRSDFVLTTKTMSTTADGLRRDLETSLRELKTDHVDVYQFHNPGFVPRPGDGTGLYEAMEEARRAGKVRFIGITNHRLARAKEAIESGLYDTLQFPFSYLSTDEERALVALCAERGVGFIAMKALAGGLITNSAAAYAAIAEAETVLPIWGVQRESELDEFLSYIENPPVMTEELRAVIEADKKELAGDFCRGCGYCMPCTVGIDIATAARMPQLIRRAPTAPWLSEAQQENMRKIEDCVDCGKCMSRCPYGLETPKLLRKALEDYKKILSGKVSVN